MENKNLLQAVFNVQKNTAKLAKTGKASKYKYAELPEILNILEEPLNNENLLVIHTTGFHLDIDVLLTSIAHVPSGESTQFMTRIVYEENPKQMSRVQNFASGVTFARKISLMGYFKLAGEDNDGNVKNQPRQIEQISDKLDDMPDGVKTLFRDKSWSKKKVADYSLKFNYNWEAIGDMLQK